MTFGALVRSLGSARRVLATGGGPGGPARLAAAVAAEGLTMDPGLAARIGPAGAAGGTLLRAPLRARRRAPDNRGSGVSRAVSARSISRRRSCSSPATRPSSRRRGRWRSWAPGARPPRGGRRRHGSAASSRPWARRWCRGWRWASTGRPTPARCSRTDSRLRCSGAATRISTPRRTRPWPGRSSERAGR